MNQPDPEHELIQFKEDEVEHVSDWERGYRRLNPMDPRKDNRRFGDFYIQINYREDKK